MLLSDEDTTIVTLLVRPRQGTVRRVAVGAVGGTVDRACDIGRGRARVVGGLFFRDSSGGGGTEVLVELRERGHYEVVVRRVSVSYDEEPDAGRRVGSFEVGDADSFRMRVLNYAFGETPRPLLECPLIIVEDIPCTAPPPVNGVPVSR